MAKSLLGTPNPEVPPAVYHGRQFSGLIFLVVIIFIDKVGPDEKMGSKLYLAVVKERNRCKACRAALTPRARGSSPHG